MSEDPIQIELLGRKHAVLIPDFATREEVTMAYHAAVKKGKRGASTLLRVYSAAIGLCTRLGRESGADYSDCGCDPLVYGGRVYSWLREKDCDAATIATQAVPIVIALAHALFPREQEVEARKKDSGEQGGSPTSPPSDSP